MSNYQYVVSGTLIVMKNDDGHMAVFTTAMDDTGIVVEERDFPHVMGKLTDQMCLYMNSAGIAWDGNRMRLGMNTHRHEDDE